MPLAAIHIAETRRFDGSLIPSQNCQLEWMIYCRGPICLGQGYNMPRKRGSNAISQNYPGVRRGGRGGWRRYKIFLLLPLFSTSLGKVQRVGCKILGEHCFQCEHPEGTPLSLPRWPENIQRAIKYPGIGIPISAIEKWRNVATGGVLYCDGRLSRWIESE